MGHVQETEAQVIERARDGDRTAFSILYDSYSKEIYRYLLAQIRHQQDAEDLLVEVFLRAWRFLPRYREQGYQFSAFLYRVARNALIDHYREVNSHHKHIVADESSIEQQVCDQATPEERRLHLDAHSEIYKILVQLNDDYRDVLILRFLSGFSPEETAHAMGRSAGAVRVLQHRALKALRKLISEEEIESILSALH